MRAYLIRPFDCPWSVCVIDLVAVRAFTQDGVSYDAGQSLSVLPIVAAALTYQRKAVFSHQYQRRDLVAESPEPQKRRRRSYRRRDLVAEPA